MVTHIFTQPPASTITKLPTSLLNWLNWFHFLLLEADPLVILISCMIFLSPFLYAMRISTVSFPSQLHVIHVAVGLEVISTFCFWVLTKQLSYMLFIFTFVFFLVIPCFVVAFQPCMAWIPFFFKCISILAHIINICNGLFSGISWNYQELKSPESVTWKSSTEKPVIFISGKTPTSLSKLQSNLFILMDHTANIYRFKVNNRNTRKIGKNINDLKFTRFSLVTISLCLIKSKRS